MAKLPLNVSTISNKRALENDDNTEDTKKKRVVSKSTPIEKSGSKVRTITTVIGKVPVDSECTTMLGKAHVYCENNDVFDCMLNQVKYLDNHLIQNYLIWI